MEASTIAALGDLSRSIPLPAGQDVSASASDETGCWAEPLAPLEHLMSPEQKALVKETWRKVTPLADTAARLFYDRLFDIDVTTRPLFKTTNLVEQRRKLIQALTMVVQGLDHVEALVPTLADMGRRHAQYGVTDAHYDTVGAAFAVDARARARIGVDAGGEGCLVQRLRSARRCHARGRRRASIRARSFRPKSRAHLRWFTWPRPLGSPILTLGVSRAGAESSSLTVLL
jgi:Globin